MKAHPQQTKDRAVECLLIGMNVTDAAAKIKIGRRTLARWLHHDEDFRRQLEHGRQAIFDQHVATLATMTGEGIERLRQILRDDSAGPAHWIKVTELLLQQGRASEAATIRERMDEIERLLAERGGL